MAQRHHVGTTELTEDPLDPATILSGTPVTRSVELWASADGTASRGVWEITPGVVTDVEADEMFVVLSGRATIEFDHGAPMEIGPGDLVMFEQGERTTWTVHETLRKVFHLHTP